MQIKELEAQQLAREIFITLIASKPMDANYKSLALYSLSAARAFYDAAEATDQVTIRSRRPTSGESVPL